MTIISLQRTWKQADRRKRKPSGVAELFIREGEDSEGSTEAVLQWRRRSSAETTWTASPSGRFLTLFVSKLPKLLFVVSGLHPDRKEFSPSEKPFFFF